VLFRSEPELAVVAAAPVINDETVWIVDYTSSRLEFIGEEKGRAFKGAFGGFPRHWISFENNARKETENSVERLF